jgi:purine-binding chemotaxis protein CheW
VVDTTTPVPGAPPSLIGVMNLRGTVLPVVEARPLLGLPVRTRGDRALVVADGERRAAIVIEGVLGLTALDDVQPAAGDVAPAAVADEPSRATLLDARAILAAIRRAWDPAPGG